VYLSPPLGGHGTSLAGGEKLFFERSFVGSEKRPIEISQKLVHALDLHFIEERNAYCRLDDDGDLDDVISVVELNENSWTEAVTVVTIAAKDFWEYARLSRMGMVIFFDFTRVNYGSFNSWNGERPFNQKARDLFYHGGLLPGHASYVAGRMVARPAITHAEIVRARKEARDPLSRCGIQGNQSKGWQTTRGVLQSKGIVKLFSTRVPFAFGDVASPLQGGSSSPLQSRQRKIRAS
jgi:hypothetical protein